MKKHITILISPDGEEFYDAYGPMTKDRSKALEYHSNDKTLGCPSRFGRNRTAFWESEKRAEASSLKEYKNWSYKHVPIEE